MCVCVRAHIYIYMCIHVRVCVCGYNIYSLSIAPISRLTLEKPHKLLAEGSSARFPKARACWKMES